MVTTIGSIFHFHDYLAKLQYFTNLGFSEIRGPISLPKVRYLLGAQNSCEVAIIWPDLLPWLPVASMIFYGSYQQQSCWNQILPRPKAPKNCSCAEPPTKRRIHSLPVGDWALTPRDPQDLYKRRWNAWKWLSSKRIQNPMIFEMVSKGPYFFWAAKKCILYNIFLFKHGTYVQPTILFKSSP